MNFVLSSKALFMVLFSFGSCFSSHVPTLHFGLAFISAIMVSSSLISVPFLVLSYVVLVWLFHLLQIILLVENGENSCRLFLQI